MTIEERKDTAKKEEPKSQRQKEIEELRKSRVAPGIPQPNLTAPGRDGYVRRWVCDRPGRLEKFWKGGWRFVKKDAIESPLPQELKISTREGLDDRVSQAVGSHKSGKEMIGYLMEVPEELYQEDQAVKMGYLDELEKGLMQGSLPGQGKGDLTTNTSVPIKVKTTVGSGKPPA